MMVEDELYELVVAKYFHPNRITSQEFVRVAHQNHPILSQETLRSIYSQHYQAFIKNASRHHRKRHVMDSYLNRFNRGEPIHSIARSVGFSPVLLARNFLQGILGTTNKKQLSGYIRCPETIPDERLRREITLCCECDDQYSPAANKARLAMGQAYERRLNECLAEAKIPFSGEDQLRAEGYARTPDARLLVPIAVNGQLVTWIDSKAMFGDATTHELHRKTQFAGYCRR